MPEKLNEAHQPTAKYKFSVWHWTLERGANPQISLLFIVGRVVLPPDHSVHVKSGTFAIPNSGSILPQLTYFKHKNNVAKL
jgi:hypothetical protein